jgi:hypothetical protein
LEGLASVFSRFIPQLLPVTHTAHTVVFDGLSDEFSVARRERLLLGMCLRVLRLLWGLGFRV